MTIRLYSLNKDTLSALQLVLFISDRLNISMFGSSEKYPDDMQGDGDSKKVRWCSEKQNQIMNMNISRVESI